MLAPSHLPESKQSLVAQLVADLDSHALAWLSGYFAAAAEAGAARGGTMHVDVAQHRLAIHSAPPSFSVASAPSSAQRLTIIYGSQTGNAKRVAEALAEQAQAAGIAHRLVRADRYATRELRDEHLLYIVMSTQGDGDPPDDSLAFVDFLASRRAPRLPQLKFAVLGLGDSSYPFFCGIARHLDERLVELGAQRLHDLGMADLDIETVALPWQESAITVARHNLKLAEAPAPTASITPLRPAAAKVSREQPFLAELLLNQPITGRDSDKDVRHLEISLQGSDLAYRPGDALGVWPTQSADLVDRVIGTLDLNPDEPVQVEQSTRSLREWLTHHRELTQLTRPFLNAHAARCDSDALRSALRPEAVDEFKALLQTRQLIDILKAHPATWTAQALVKALRPLTPRMYSIASSLASVDDEVHLTLANVVYEHEGETRWGAASNFLSQLGEGDKVPVFIEENPRFRLPADSSRDVIMIGPGTGIAPFRAFVQERSAVGATGRNWVFFGNPHFASDFLYQTEWQRALQDGQLHRLDLAFSRDQSHKVYVQDRMEERASELYEWIQGGAHLYVCGDATRMAKDVHQTLLQIARQEGALDDAEAKQWLDDLAAQGRYARDVY
jgi:sulfite reductase (NADPH) flavoprotein alpha-component